MWPPSAAIFDLDRTVLRGPSGPAINEALVDLGLRDGKFLGEEVLYRPTSCSARTRLAVALARAAALGVRGWSVDRMLAAGRRRAADLLARQVVLVCAFVAGEHRRARPSACARHDDT